MRKCGIITMYDNNYNYGGQLQAFAMCELLRSAGVEPMIISFVISSKKYIIQRILQLGVKETIIRVAKKWKYLHSQKGNNTNYSKKINKYKEFMALSPHSTTYNESNIYKTNSLFDFFVCGSDQIWNPGWWNDIYFLCFANKPKFSYAASIARDSLSNKEKKYLKSKVSDFIGISVREKQAEDLLKSFVEKKVCTVLDPTLMIDKEIWHSLAVTPNSESNYVLIYKIGEVTSIVREIYDICHSKGIKVYVIGHAKNTYDKDDKLIADLIIDDCGPQEWLGLIKNASCVFTDSFHGTIFSIIFERKFWCFEKNSRHGQNENSRLYNILDLVNLRSRMINHANTQYLNLLEQSIDYHDVDKRLEPFIDASFAYVKTCIERVESRDTE